ncbi:Rieske 2Fe-2S domain-containing protein [Streptomyces wedmorensis]
MTEATSGSTGGSKRVRLGYAAQPQAGHPFTATEHPDIVLVDADSSRPRALARQCPHRGHDLAVHGKISPDGHFECLHKGFRWRSTGEPTPDCRAVGGLIFARAYRDESGVWWADFGSEDRPEAQANEPLLVISSAPVDQSALLDGRRAELAYCAASAFREAAGALRGGTVRDDAKATLRGAYDLLGHLVDGTGELAAQAAAAAGSSDLSDEVQIYDAYFGVARAAQLSAAPAVASAAPTLRALAADLLHAPLTPDDAAGLAEFAAGFLTTSRAEVSHAPLVIREAIGEDQALPACTPQTRWRLGHRVYALANRSAAAALAAAGTLLKRGDLTGTVAQLRQAVKHVRALTAAMHLAAAMSADSYRASVRPTMAPPALSIELTGAMNVDHASYRSALMTFLARYSTLHAEAKIHSPDLALSLEQVLHADLNDLEAHIGLTYRLIGEVPALDEHADGSAVQALRGLYLRRVVAYGPYLRINLAA